MEVIDGRFIFWRKLRLNASKGCRLPVIYDEIRLSQCRPQKCCHQSIVTKFLPVQTDKIFTSLDQPDFYQSRPTSFSTVWIDEIFKISDRFHQRRPTRFLPVQTDHIFINPDIPNFDQSRPTRLLPVPIRFL